MKAVIATDVIFILFLIGLVIGASLIIFWKWISGQTTIANEFACKTKWNSYCSDLIQGKQTNWNELPPTQGCEKYDVVQPSEQECKR